MGRILFIGRSRALAEAMRDDSELRDHEVLFCLTALDAVRRLRRQAVDVVLTDPDTPIDQDLGVAHELSAVRPGVRIIALAPSATNQEVIEALRAHVFACFTEPLDPLEILDMVRLACRAPGSQHGIQVVSGLPHWLTLRVSCRLVSAERLVSFMSELTMGVADAERDLLVAAFRELLLNAMEHGAGFDAEQVIEVTAAKTARAIVYHFRDPGNGFNPDDLEHAAAGATPEEVVASAVHRAEAGLRPGGFGMLIARQVADELVYNERHNEVLLIKHLS
jgi:DNA-binding response OmpR family regulator